MANGFQHMSQIMPTATYIYGRNGHFTNCTYQGNQNRRNTYHTAPFMSSNHRGSPRSSEWFYSTSPCKFYNNVFHNSNITTDNLETSPPAGNTFYKGNILSFIMTEWTIIQAVLKSIESFDGTKTKFEAWTESIGNAVQILGQRTVCTAFSKLTGSPVSTVNRLNARSPYLM